MKVCSKIEDSNSLDAESNEEHEQKEENEHEQEIEIEKNIAVQERPKIFRCKQCNTNFTSKEEFWLHNRIHIRPERMLTCPKCPFVTEFRHHLEYHLRNHFGSKPFKCEKCTYSCVNKSMLNSHLKSHSNVYQYRCNDCDYITKYLHSLKIHLRKYQHKPAVVLNPDGTPNPFPVVDVYGTRRGPKPKPASKQDDSPFNMQLQMNSIINSFYLHMLSPAQGVLPVPSLSTNGTQPCNPFSTVSYSSDVLNNHETRKIPLNNNNFEFGSFNRENDMEPYKNLSDNSTSSPCFSKSRDDNLEEEEVQPLDLSKNSVQKLSEQ